MTYSEWGKLSEAERIAQCTKALGWTIGDYEEWDPLRSRDDCQALIEAVANHSPSAVVAFSAALATSDLEYTESAAVAWCASHWLALFCADPDLLAWAACEALLEGHD